jgi:hypothetical protein
MAQGLASFILIFIFLLSFGFGAGPIPWSGAPCADTEFLPLRLRAFAMAVIGCLNWILVALILVSERLIESDPHGYRYLLFGCFSLLGVPFGFFFVRVPRDEVHRQVL